MGKRKAPLGPHGQQKPKSCCQNDSVQQQQDDEGGGDLFDKIELLLAAQELKTMGHIDSVIEKKAWSTWTRVSRRRQ